MSNNENQQKKKIIYLTKHIVLQATKTEIVKL